MKVFYPNNIFQAVCLKVLFLLFLFFFACTSIFSQEDDFEEGYFEGESSGQSVQNIEYKLGEGLGIDLENGKYQFQIGGWIHPLYVYEELQKYKENPTGKNETVKNRLKIIRGRLSLSASAFHKKAELYWSSEYTRNFPLYDAWIAFQPYEALRLSFGQKLTFLNNRTFYSDSSKLTFAQRSPLSERFTNTGREFGFYIESDLKALGMVFKPKAAISSGDGINSFGANSSDKDSGGFKYGARFDFLPLGEFKKGGDYFGQDTQREPDPKLAIGGAVSINEGASEAKGEGHNQLFLYDFEGKQALPDYRKIYASLLFKQAGFSFLAEYANASVKAQDLFFDPIVQNPFVGETVSEKFVLGQAYNIQTGYLFSSLTSIDFRYTDILPEFPEYESDEKKLKRETWYTLGLSQYFFGCCHYKVALAVSYIDRYRRDSIHLSLLTQIKF